MTHNQSSSRHKWLQAALIVIVVFGSYAYFYQAGGWNQNSRFDLVRAILDERTLRIDSYHSNTEDKAVFQGHYYSDKAPGIALLAVPAVAASRPILRAVGLDVHSPRGLLAQSYVATMTAVCLPSAFAAGCLFLLAQKLGASTRASLFGALSLALASPVWAWSTIFFGHAVVGAFLLFAFASAIQLRDSPRGWPELAWGLAVGLSAGWATVSEYPAAPASVILALLALTLVWRHGVHSRWRVTVGVGAGALACLAVLMAYQYAAFGSPLAMGYTHYESGAFPWMTRGFLGLTFPRVDVLFKLLFGFHLGLFWLAPVTVAALYGIRYIWKTGERGVAAAALAVPLYYWLFNGAFSGWHGGWTYGPRYMGAGIAILCVGLAPAWSRAGQKNKLLLAALAIWGIALSLMAVATTAQPPQSYRVPVTQLILPSFWHGRLSLNHVSMLTAAEGTHTRAAFNLGELAGLQGLASLIPLLLFWMVIAAMWVLLARREYLEVKSDVRSATSRV
jgi:hypothetical protein